MGMEEGEVIPPRAVDTFSVLTDDDDNEAESLDLDDGIFDECRSNASVTSSVVGGCICYIDRVHSLSMNRVVGNA